MEMKALARLAQTVQMCISVIHHTNFNSGAQQENSAWGQTPASNGFCAAYDPSANRFAIQPFLFTEKVSF